MTERYRKYKEKYENVWLDISTFVKFGCIKDEEFYQTVQNIIIYKNILDEYHFLESYSGGEVSNEDAKVGKEP